MAIAFNAANQQVVSGSLTNTIALSSSGSNRLVIAVIADDGKGTMDVTYNGASLTSILGVEDTSGFFKFHFFYLLNPDTGSNNLVATRGINTGDFYLIGATYTGIKQTGQPDASTTNAQTAGTSQTTSITTVADNSWSMLLTGADSGNLAASTNSSLRGSILNGFFGFFDSNSAITPASSFSMSTTMNSGLRTAIMVSFAPAIVVVEEEGIFQKRPQPNTWYRGYDVASY